jgi:hypothetical protein
MTMDFKKPSNKPCPWTEFVAQPVLERGHLLIEEILFMGSIVFDLLRLAGHCKSAVQRKFIEMTSTQ